MIRSWSQDLMARVLVLRPGDRGFGLGVKVFWRSW